MIGQESGYNNISCDNIFIGWESWY
jgi:hypothetical protein